MGVFKLRPTENRQMGYTASDNLWEDNEMNSMWGTRSNGGGGSMNRGTATYRGEPHPVNLLLDRMDEMEAHLGKKMEEMQGQMGQGGSIDQLTEKVEELVGEALEVAKNPPDTWKQYLEQKNPVGIVTMESEELKKALQKGDKKGAKKEIVHTLAAILRAGI